MARAAEQKAQPSSAEHVEVIVALLLRVGVSISAAVMIVGLLMLFITPSRQNLAHLTAPTDLGDIIRGVITLQPVAIIQTGLLLLIITPVMRVVSAAIVYTLEGDKDYTFITGFVLAVLLIGMLLGRVG